MIPREVACLRRSAWGISPGGVGSRRGCDHFLLQLDWGRATYDMEVTYGTDQDSVNIEDTLDLSLGPGGLTNGPSRIRIQA